MMGAWRKKQKSINTIPNWIDFLKAYSRTIYQGFAVLSLLLVGLLPALAQTQYYYETLINSDGDTQTGCVVSYQTPAAQQVDFNGADLGARLTVRDGEAVELHHMACVAGAWTSTGIDAQFVPYTVTSPLLEMSLPLPLNQVQLLTVKPTLGVAASTQAGFAVADVLWQPFGSGGGGGGIAITPFGLTDSVPSLGLGITVLLALLVGGVVLRHRSMRQRIIAHPALWIMVMLLSVPLVWATVHMVVDGLSNDWQGRSVLARDTINDGSHGATDVVNVWAALDNQTLFVRMDVTEKPSAGQPPIDPLGYADFRIVSVNVTEPVAGQVRVSGRLSGIYGDAAQVELTNTRTQQRMQVAVNQQAWQGDIAAAVGDVLQLVPINSQQQRGGIVAVTVQGTAVEPVLPPDPASIAPALDPSAPYILDEAVKFIYTGNDPIQKGVNPDDIKPLTAGLMVGKVVDNAQQALSGVTVSVKDHTEFGYTLSRADGQWDLVVNGGQWLTVEYRKQGYLPVQRKVEVDW